MDAADDLDVAAHQPRTRSACTHCQWPHITGGGERARYQHSHRREPRATSVSPARHADRAQAVAVALRLGLLDGADCVDGARRERYRADDRHRVGGRGRWCTRSRQSAPRTGVGRCRRTVVEHATSVADVVVLVDPTPKHWKRAREVDAAVVLLSHPIPEGGVGCSRLSKTARAMGRVVATVVTLCERCVAWRRVTAHSRVPGTRPIRHARQASATRKSASPCISPGARSRSCRRSTRASRASKRQRSLGISPRTVENTQRVLFRKLGVRTRAQAVARAYALGAIDLSSEPRP